MSLPIMLGTPYRHIRTREMVTVVEIDTSGAAIGITWVLLQGQFTHMQFSIPLEQFYAEYVQEMIE